MEQIEDSEVVSEKELSEVLEVFNQMLNDGHFVCNMSGNCILDWFGKVVKGSVEIQDFMRKILPKYQHKNFVQAKMCQSIESNYVHLSTTNLQKKDYLSTHPRNKVNGVTSLKRYADSDFEDDDGMLPLLSSSHILENRSAISLPTDSVPPTNIINSAQLSSEENENEIVIINEDQQKTPLNVLKIPKYLVGPHFIRRSINFSNSDSDDIDEEDGLITKRKRRNDLLRRSNSPISESESSSLDTPALVEPEVDPFTSLRYLETTGIFVKGPDWSSGHNRTKRIPINREVQIRISYRKHIRYGTYKLALIIYKHQETYSAFKQTRRNLMQDFLKYELMESDLASGSPEHDVSLGKNLSSGTLVLPADAVAIQTEPLDTSANTQQIPSSTPKRKPPLLGEDSSSAAKKMSPLVQVSNSKRIVRNFRF